MFPSSDGSFTCLAGMALALTLPDVREKVAMSLMAATPALLFLVILEATILHGSEGGFIIDVAAFYRLTVKVTLCFPLKLEVALLPSP